MTNQGNSNYPTLDDWLTGTPSDHIWKKVVSSDPLDSQNLLNTMEMVLATLVAESPTRLASLKVRFQNDVEVSHQIDLRYELLIASRIVSNNLQIEFGDIGEADIHILNNDIRIELTTRARDDVHTLHDELELALAGYEVVVCLTMPVRQLAIGEPTRNSIKEKICSEVATLADEESITIDLPEIGGRASCQKISPLGDSRVSLSIGAGLESHMSDIQREVFNVLRKKEEQFQRNNWNPNTLLFIDVSRLGAAWLRPQSVWQQVLPALGVDWSACSFLGIVITYTSLDTARVDKSIILRPGLNQTQISEIDNILNSFDDTI